jgi:hypothetical protein
LLRDKGLPLKAWKVVDATLVSAPSSTNSASGERGPEMHQTNKGFASSKLSFTYDGNWPVGITRTLQVNAEAKGRCVPQAAGVGNSIEIDVVVGQC